MRREEVQEPEQVRRVVPAAQTFVEGAEVVDGLEDACAADHCVPLGLQLLEDFAMLAKHSFHGR